jgi:hypothetical protein
MQLGMLEMQTLLFRRHGAARPQRLFAKRWLRGGLGIIRVSEGGQRSAQGEREQAKARCCHWRIPIKCKPAG